MAEKYEICGRKNMQSFLHVFMSSKCILRNCIISILVRSGIVRYISIVSSAVSTICTIGAIGAVSIIGTIRAVLLRTIIFRRVRNISICRTFNELPLSC
jgi:hypothetical protein